MITKRAPTEKATAFVLVTPLLAVIIGIVWEELFHPSLILIGTTLLICGLVLVGIKKYHGSRFPAVKGAALLFLMSLAGLCRSAQWRYYELANDLLSRSPTVAYGRVIDLQQTSNTKVPWVMRISLMCINDQYVNPCDIWCYLRKKPRCEPGSWVTMQLPASTPQDQKPLSGHPSYGDYLVKEHIVGVYFVGTESIRSYTKPRASIIGRLYHVVWHERTRVCQAIKNALCSSTYLFLSTIFLGMDKFSIVDSTRQHFNMWGITHYLARSGLHIVLVVATWRTICAYLPISFALKRLLLLLLGTIYVILSGSSVPFTRGASIFLATEFGMLIWGRPLFPHLLSLLTMILLLHNPAHLFFLDFQLSFGLTFALILGASRS